MKIVSWNVNGIRACRKKGFDQFAQKINADLLCLQETKAHSEQVDLEPKKLKVKELYWSSAEKKGYSGTLSICKQEPLEVTKGIGIKKFDSEGRFVVTEFKDFLVYNIYFPNGAASEERHLYKMDFLKAMYKQTQKDLQKAKSLIVLGDYNIAHREEDIHDPVRLDGMSGFKPEEREWMDKYFALGMHDSFRLKHPKKKENYSWWSYRAGSRERNKGWRIDYISVSSDLKDRVKSARILTDVMGSDHCPILLELRN